MKDQLFTGEEKSDQTAQQVQAKLFDGEYQVAASVDKGDADEQENKAGKTTLFVLAGAGLVLAGGIYAVSRKVFE
ncbi:type VII secretion protein EssA [Listeria floridensis]|uniref:type VII secretion protein EssA n=1 Tax=Listeria floridensis TaxID=1494962 RepID=UPI0004BA2999|nr:type VII secretion protein EssA [Listeria floridensis]